VYQDSQHSPLILWFGSDSLKDYKLKATSSFQIELLIITSPSHLDPLYLSPPPVQLARHREQIRRTSCSRQHSFRTEPSPWRQSPCCMRLARPRQRSRCPCRKPGSLVTNLSSGVKRKASSLWRELLWIPKARTPFSRSTMMAPSSP
jgi:hypothetical protein